MPEHNETIALRVLGVAIFERQPDGSFRVEGQLPGWCFEDAGHDEAGSSAVEPTPVIELAAKVPLFDDLFLTNFLVKANSFWETYEDGFLKSGVWQPKLGAARELVLEAIVVNSEQTRLLILREASSIGIELADYHESGRRSRLELLRDITRREQLELELAAARDTAERLDRAKSEFLGNVSHEMRTPLTGICGICDLLLSENLSERHRQHLLDLRQAGKTLQMTVDQILDVVEIESEMIEIHASPFDLRRAIGDLMRMYRPAALERGIRLRTELSTELPALIVSDEKRLVALLNSLLDNAIRFTEQGSVTIGTKMVSDREIGISVIDTGIGIGLDHQKRVIDCFAQVDASAARATEGLGLGLTVAHRLAMALGGSLDLTSRLGEGSEFRLQIPIVPGMVTPMPVHGTCGLKPIAIGCPLRVLVAEDNRINRRFVSYILEKAGYEVVEVENGRQAIERLEESEFDLVLMDCHMPEMSGYETAIEIRRQEASSGRHLPIVAVTANATSENRRRCRKAGMDVFVAKPFRHEELLEAVSASMRGNQPNMHSSGG